MTVAKHIQFSGIKCVFIFCLLLSSIGLKSQSLNNYSGLRNTELAKLQCDGTDANQEIRTQLPGGGLPAFGSQAMPGATPTFNPKIDRVSILDERSSELKGEIYFNGFTNGSIRVFVLSSNGNEIKEVPAQIIMISGSSGMLDFNLKLASTYTSSAFLKSSLLRIAFTPKDHNKGKTFCFTMNKRWKVFQDNENIIVKAQTVPFGKAANAASYDKMQKPGNPLKTSQNAEINGSAVNKIRKDSLIDSEGISNQTISLFEDFYTDYKFASPSEISSIQLDAIYQDKNINSGVYYYRPSAYNLSWEEQEGFKFSMQYGKGSGTSDGAVNMAASLSCDVNNNEADLIAQIIKTHVENKGRRFEEARAIIPSDPRISFQGNAQAFNIGSDKFSANVLSSIYEPITMAWTASSDATNEMIAALGENIAIAGNVSYSPGVGVSNVSVPLRINLADKTTFGRIELDKGTWRSQRWKNKFPYGIKIKNLHSIILFSDGSPCIYTWNLGDKSIPSHAQLEFEGQSVPAWMDTSSKVLRMWVEYEVLPCKECDQEVIDMISSGTTSGKQRTVSFRSLGLMSRYNAKYIKLEVRSKALDPRGKTTLIKSITIEQDERNYDIGPFYVWNDKDLRYEYRITLINDDTSIEGSSWIGDNSLEIMMNKSVAERCLGNNLPRQKN